MPSSDRETERLPHEFRRIRLQLAREPGHPEGSRDIGYVVVAPLTPDGHLDVHLAREHRKACSVVRVRPDAEPTQGELRRGPGGRWSFHYEQAVEAEADEAAYRLGAHRFVAGEYVTIVDESGAHAYRVVSVEPL